MGRLAWYKRDPRSSLDDTLHLSLEEAGAYGKVLDLLFMMDDRLPDDPAFIVRWLNCDGRVWKRIRQQLIDKDKLYAEAGYLRSKAVATYLATHLAKPQLGDSEPAVSAKNNNLDAPSARVLEKKNKKENQEPQTPETPTPRPSEPELPLAPSAPAHIGSNPPLSEPDGFAAFYAAYPKKVDRPKALSAYRTARKFASVEVIAAGLRRWVAGWESERTDRKYIPAPAVWLHGHRWADDAPGQDRPPCPQARASPPMDPRLAARLAEANARKAARASAEAAGLKETDEEYEPHVSARMLEWYKNEQRRSA